MKKKLLRKVFFGFGAVSIVALPIATVISCGAEVSGGVAWERGEKTASFNLNGTKSEPPFLPYAQDNSLSSAGLIKLASDFSAAIVQNNVLKLPNNTEITMNVLGDYTYDIPPSQGNLNPTHVIVHFVLPVKFVYMEQSPLAAQFKDIPLVTNISDALITLLTTTLPGATSPINDNPAVTSSQSIFDQANAEDITINSSTLKALGEVANGGPLDIDTSKGGTVETSITLKEVKI